MDINAYAIPGVSICDDRIIESVSKVYGISSKNILVPSRKRNVTEPRQVAIFLIIVIGRKGTKYIENHYQFNHSTANYSINIVKALYTVSIKYRKNITSILDDLNISKSDRAIVLSFLQSGINWNDFKKNI